MFCSLTQREVKPGFIIFFFSFPSLYQLPSGLVFLLNHIWLKFIFCHIPQRATSRFNVTRIYDLSLLSPRRAETELPAERLSHKNTDDAVDGRRSHEWLKLKFYQRQCRQTGSGQTVVLVSRAAQPFSGTLTAAQAHTAKKKGSINLVYCFSGSRRGQTIQNVI